MFFNSITNILSVVNSKLIFPMAFPCLLNKLLQLNDIYNFNYALFLYFLFMLKVIKIISFKNKIKIIILLDQYQPQIFHIKELDNTMHLLTNKTNYHMPKLELYKLSLFMPNLYFLFDINLILLNHLFRTKNVYLLLLNIVDITI